MPGGFVNGKNAQYNAPAARIQKTAPPPPPPVEPPPTLDMKNVSSFFGFRKSKAQVTEPDAPDPKANRLSMGDLKPSDAGASTLKASSMEASNLGVGPIGVSRRITASSHNRPLNRPASQKKPKLSKSGRRVWARIGPFVITRPARSS